MENKNLIDFSEVKDGDQWELFARDFFVEQGLVVESAPSRGADAGKDLLVSEQQIGRLGARKFTWLVSCKNNAKSGKSVGVGEETDILERLRQHNADGFIGFYSTLASSALSTRLQSLKDKADIADFKIYDARLIEHHFISDNMSKIAIRYFPEGYRRLKPIQKITNEYVPLICEACEKDILKNSVIDPYAAIVLFATERSPGKIRKSIHISCKGACTTEVERRLELQGLTTGWQDIGDLVNPVSYLKFYLSYMNQIRTNPENTSDDFHEQMKDLLIALSQRTLREITSEDFDRFMALESLPSYL